MSHKKRKHPTNRLYQPLAIASLIAGGVLQPLYPVLALTAADVSITNKASASFTDPNDSTKTITVESNEVSIKVAPVGGLTNVWSDFKDKTGTNGSVEADDVLYFDFKVTNTGNYTTDIYVPGTKNDNGRKIDTTELGLTNFVMTDTPDGSAATTAAGFDTANGGGLPTNNIFYSKDNGANWSLLPADGIVTDVAQDQDVIVRVVGKAPSTVPAGDRRIQVRLGNTGDVKRSDFADTVDTTTTQNIADNSPDTGLEPDDVRSVAGTTIPVNGQREAAAASPNSIAFGTSSESLALATVRKTLDSSNAGSTTTKTDDTLTYKLSLEVQSSTSVSGITPGRLEGTTIKLSTGDAERILVSDTIPDGAELQSVDFSNLPTGWQVVYSTDDPASSDAVVSTGRTAATWTVIATNDATVLKTAKRIGFVYTGSLDAGYNIESLGKKLGFTVNTSKVTNQTQINNIAQVFGQTENESTNKIVYDESGDGNFNNYTDAGVAPTSNYDPATNSGQGSGIADPTNGVDTGNINSGLDTSGTSTVQGGEVNVYSFVITSSSILNGPLNTPGAVNTNDNDDFTSKSVSVPNNTDVSGAGTIPTVDPGTIRFTNTVRNPDSNSPLNNVTIQPILASEADSIVAGLHGEDTDIPDGTTVTIKFGSQEATYTYTDTSGVKSWLLGSVSHVNIGTLEKLTDPSNPGDAQKDYTVEITAPDGSPILKKYPISLVAFPDNGNNGYDTEDIRNVTVNQVYTGFMQVKKEARILKDSTTAINPTTGADIANPTASDGWATTFASTVKIQPGWFIEYRITYTNLAQAPLSSGSGNVALTATNFKVTEDGNVPGGNNWAAYTSHQKNTVADLGSVTYTSSSASTTTVDPSDNESVVKYENETGDIAPSVSQKFQFRRKLN